MGFLSKFIGNSEPEKSSNSSAITGGHSIDRNHVLRQTDPGVFSPTNPGNFDSIRTCMVLEGPRYFTAEEAQKFEEIARKTSEGVRYTKKATKALVKIDTNDKKVHNNYYRKYAPKIADNELSKLRATGSYARHLHAQRPGYAALNQSLQQAENKADQQIAMIAESLR
jgi:hypothetical protein